MCIIGIGHKGILPMYHINPPPPPLEWIPRVISIPPVSLKTSIFFLFSCSVDEKPCFECFTFASVVISGHRAFRGANLVRRKWTRILRTNPEIQLETVSSRISGIFRFERPRATNEIHSCCSKAYEKREGDFTHCTLFHWGGKVKNDEEEEKRAQRSTR